MRIFLIMILMCYSLEEFAQTNTTKPVSSNWLLVNNIPKKPEPVTNPPVLVTETKPDLAVTNSEIKFYADKDSLKLGEGTFLNWDIPTEDRVSISYSVDNDKFEIISDAFASKGKHKVSPKKIMYYKLKTGTIEKTIKVTLIEPSNASKSILKKSAIEYFYVENEQIKLGESTKLKWAVLDINNITLETSVNGMNWTVEENTLYGNTGEKIISPKKNIYYRLIADDATIKLKVEVIK